ncbi:hypothetical protein EVAR_34440_1 [Eumeta japonica]|uniref:Uncharacterized protein n=1 Tax=Eumeta variegata TaxID=151549 RepID=A0A4C1WN52_EUMVA|nr:hypothetical protein EVAR_34440_1 [Eumeta japonica]
MDFEYNYNFGDRCRIAELSQHPGSSLSAHLLRAAPPTAKPPLPVYAKQTPSRESLKPSNSPRHGGSAASTFGVDINKIISILQVVRSVEVFGLAAKFTLTKHDVDSLRIILHN